MHKLAHLKEINLRCPDLLLSCELLFCSFVLEIWTMAHIVDIRHKELQSKKSGLKLSKEVERNVVIGDTI